MIARARDAIPSCIKHANRERGMRAASTNSPGKLLISLERFLGKVQFIAKSLRRAMQASDGVIISGELGCRHSKEGSS